MNQADILKVAHSEYMSRVQNEIKDTQTTIRNMVARLVKEQTYYEGFCGMSRTSSHHFYENIHRIDGFFFGTDYKDTCIIVVMYDNARRASRFIKKYESELEIAWQINGTPTEEDFSGVILGGEVYEPETKILKTLDYGIFRGMSYYDAIREGVEMGCI